MIRLLECFLWQAIKERQNKIENHYLKVGCLGENGQSELNVCNLMLMLYSDLLDERDIYA